MPASAPELRKRPRTAIRVLATAEVVLIMGLIFLIIWVVKPLGRSSLDLSVRILLGILLLGSPWLHHDSRQRLGLRFDTFPKALVRLLPVSLLAAAVSFGAGYYLVSIEPPENAALELAYYFAWATAQQYALQAVILLRLEDAGLGGRAGPAAATLFSVVHAPNPGLLILTFLGGLLWCSTFRRHPNLFAVALGHAALAVIVEATLPPEVTGGTESGPLTSHESEDLKI